MAKTFEELVPADLPSCLRGVRYPAWKRDLLMGARLNKAPRQVMDVLRQIPEEEYRGLADVLRNYKRLIRCEWFPPLQN